MYLHPGHAYVYFNYGAHFMLNVASEPEGIAGGILIRALEPLEGLRFMQRHRGGTTDMKPVELTRGPGRLASALQIDRRHDGIDLTGTGSSLWLGELMESREASNSIIETKRVVSKTVRIGITHAAEKLLRFYEVGNPFVSGPKRLLSSSKQNMRSAQPRKRRKKRNKAPH